MKHPSRDARRPPSSQREARMRIFLTRLDFLSQHVVASSNSIDQRAGRRRVCLVRPTVAMHRRGYDDDDDKYSKAKAQNIRSHAPSASSGDGCVPRPSCSTMDRSSVDPRLVSLVASRGSPFSARSTSPTLTSSPPPFLPVRAASSPRDRAPPPRRSSPTPTPWRLACAASWISCRSVSTGTRTNPRTSS